MASVTGSPGEFDIFICLRTSPWSIDSMTNSNVKSNKTIKNIPKDSSKYYNCQVLAVIEVKRNIDDIGTAFSGLQPAITWLTGNKVIFTSFFTFFSFFSYFSFLNPSFFYYIDII